MPFFLSRNERSRFLFESAALNRDYDARTDELGMPDVRAPVFDVSFVRRAEGKVIYGLRGGPSALVAAAIQ